MAQIKKILCVDDVQYYLDVLLQLFEPIPEVQCVCASDGREAFQVFQAHWDDQTKTSGLMAIITDVQMPYWDGFALAAGVRSLSADFPIIVWSSDPVYGRDPRIQSLGVSAFFQKPLVSPEAFVSVVLSAE